MKGSLMYKSLVVILLAVFCCSVADARAESIKNRMIERLPVIAELKAKGIVGEDNRGYLSFVGSAKAQQDVVQAENDDRRTVYEAIARQQGTTAAVVGERRAKQIAEKAVPGEWLQNDSGKWYKK